MALPYELAVGEDLDLGYGARDVTMPGGGTAEGSLIGIHTFIPTWVNVRDFGAVGSGGAAADTAFQAAINALSDGGTIVVPAGTYQLLTTLSFGGLVNITILLDPGVTFTGTGSLPTMFGTNHLLDLGWIHLDRAGLTNTLVGFEAGQNLTSGDSNLCFGAYAGRALTTQTRNTFIGDRAGLVNVASNNTFIGSESGARNTTGSNNTFVGRGQLQNTTGGNNTFVGAFTGGSNTTGANNTMVGVSAGTSTIDGFSLTFLGYNAGLANVSGSSCTFVGTQCGAANVNSNYNTYMGSFCALAETGQANAYYGYKAGWQSVSGDRNTYLGNSAAFNFTTADDCTVVGYDAGTGVAATGAGNTLIGSLATLWAANTNQATAVGLSSKAAEQGVAVGYGARAEGARSTALGRLAVATSDDALILGDSAPGNATRVGIGTSAPHAYAMLDLTHQVASPKCLLLPRLSAAERDALPLGAGYGFVIYTIGVGVQAYNGAGWYTL